MAAQKKDRRPALRRLSPQEIAVRRNQDALTRQHATNPPSDDRPESGRKAAQSVRDASPRDATESPRRTGQSEGGRARLDGDGVQARPVVEAPSNPSGELYVLKTDDGTVDAETRRAALHAIQPEGPRRDVAAVKQQVIALIEAIPYVSYESDRTLMTVGVAFARWAANNGPDGEFVPERDLTEVHIDDFLAREKNDVSSATQGTYASQLRRLGRAGAPRRKGIRRKAAPPYSTKTRDRMWQAACDMDGWVSAEMRTLLALTFGAGCRGAEVHDLRAHLVDRVAGRVVVSVLKDGMWVREVPVYGAFGRWLAERASQLDPDDFLFRPAYNRRRNATSDLILTVNKRTSVFVGFKTTQARHTWLALALQVGIPFHAVCQTAGLGRDSNLPTDLLPHMQWLTPVEVRRCFDRVYTRLQDAS